VLDNWTIVEAELIRNKGIVKGGVESKNQKSVDKKSRNKENIQQESETNSQHDDVKLEGPS
jgi:hypothetical protein